MASLHDYTMRTIHGEDRSLGDYAGRACLVVNVASRCGKTPQYEGLQRLYESYRERGLGTRILWLLLILTLGNFAIAAYFLLALKKLGPDRPWTALFEPAAGGRS